MFAKTLGWAPNQTLALPKLANLEQLARRGLAEARKAAQELQPLLEQTQEKLTVWATVAGEKAAELLREQLNKKRYVNRALVSESQAQRPIPATLEPAPVALPALRRGPRLLGLS